LNSEIVEAFCSFDENVLQNCSFIVEIAAI